MLNNVKLILGISDTSEDALIDYYINRSLQALKNYIEVDVLPSELNYIVEDMAVIKYQKRGSEAAKSESVGPLSTNYLDNADSIPETYKDVLSKYRKNIKFGK